MEHRLKDLVIKACLAILLGLLCGLFVWALRSIAEGAEHFLFKALNDTSNWLLMAAPLVGLVLIYFATTRVFRSKIAGVREVIEAVREPIQPLRPMKVILHFVTGILTIVFGGSTGIEVSAVVASASVGSWVGQTKKFEVNFQQYLIMAGAAAGIAGLFNSPLAGIFFVVEVLMVSFSWELILIVSLSVFAAFAVRGLLGGENLFQVSTHGWQRHALPFFILFSVVASILSVYLTRSVIYAKTFLNARFRDLGKVLAGGLFLGVMIMLAKPLYGEGYGFIDDLFRTLATDSKLDLTGIGFLLVLVLLKPLATSSTLASGGDGGVFAPSLFLGAVAGFIFAQGSNYFGASVLPINFMIVGMAAVLSASLHAPLTAAFLAMSITGSYELLIPILMTAGLSSFIARRIYPFTVYSYSS